MTKSSVENASDVAPWTGVRRNTHYWHYQRGRAAHILIDPSASAVHLSLGSCGVGSTSRTANISSRATIKGVCWIDLAFIFVFLTWFAAKGCVGNMVVVFWQPNTYISLTKLCCPGFRPYTVKLFISM